MAVGFQLLGDIEAREGDRSIDLGHARQRYVLAALLVDAGRPVPADVLIDRVWGDHPPQRARNALSAYVSRLRTVDGVTINRERTGYRCIVDRSAVDLHRFRTLVAEGCWDDALAQWRGDALGAMDTPWANGVREALAAERLAAELTRNDLALHAGQHAELMEAICARATAYPLDERLAAQAMLALYRCGRQAEALARYDQIRRRLADELGTDPAEPLRRLHTAMLRQDDALRAEPARLPTPLTEFVGRDAELTRVRTQLGRSRFVTLIGAGGAGKSRLALEVARSGADDHPDGTWLVELAPLNGPGLVMQAIARAVGVRERPNRPLADLVAERLRGAVALIVLDNCEHLVGEVAEVAHQLLLATTRLRVLATSRQRLGVTGESLRPVGGLAEADAARLLTARISALDPTFRLDESSAGPVARICRQLDGLPLALELAAAEVNGLGVADVADRLDDCFGLLTNGSRVALPRHQTLRSVVDWSYGLATAAERRLFDRVAVFVGGFSLAAAEAVAGASGTDLARLVDKSLVVAEATGATRRYRLLETLRLYGLQRLTDSGAAASTRDRHAAHVLALVESAGIAMRGPEQVRWLARLEVEHGNIRAALAWSHERGDAATALRLAGSLFLLWGRNGHCVEGRRWLSLVLGMDRPAPPEARIRALGCAAGLAVIQGDTARVMSVCTEAIGLGERVGDQAGLALAYQRLGLAALYDGAVGAAAAHLELSLRHGRQAGDDWALGWSRLFLSLIATAEGDYPRAAGHCRAVPEFTADPECLAWAQTIRAVTGWRSGDPAGAEGPLRAGLLGFRALGHLWGLSLGLFVAAQLAGDRGDGRRMAVLLGASESVRESTGAALLPFARWWRNDAAGRAAAFDGWWKEGAALSPDEAVGLALTQCAEPYPSSPNGSAGPGPDSPARSRRRPRSDRR